MAKKIEYFFVGQDVQIQIDHENPEWFDEYGKLLVEDVEEFLQDNGFIEDQFEVWRYTEDGSEYSFNEDDIQQLKRTGICRMYLI
jgi:hypothetical protein